MVGTDGRNLFSSNSFTLPLKHSLIIPSQKFIGWKEFKRDGEWQLKVASAEKKDGRMGRWSSTSKIGDFERSIHCSWQTLLMEAAQGIEEHHRAAAVTRPAGRD